MGNNTLRPTQVTTKSVRFPLQKLKDKLTLTQNRKQRVNCDRNSGRKVSINVNQ